MADGDCLVMAVTLLLGVVLVVPAVMRIWLYCASGVTRRWNAPTSAVFATVASSSSVTMVVLLSAFDWLSSVRTARIVAGIVLPATSRASMMLLVLVFLASVSIGASWCCILVGIAGAALLRRLIMTMLAIGIQTVVVLVTLILILLLAVFLSGRTVLSAPDIASSSWRIAFVLRIHNLRLECLFGGFSM
jgi:hypothetical protein